MKKGYNLFATLLMLLIFQLSLEAQSTITGTIIDDSGLPVIAATVVEKGTYNGTLTDLNGKYSIVVDKLPVVLIYSFTGLIKQEIEVNSNNVDVTLAEMNALDEIVVTGTRGKPRTILGSAVPIDNINAAELRSSGQSTVEQMLNFKVPSYNSSNQTISDATAHFDPSELRNLGPSRTLVLVNGKRKNQSALVYVNDTPGKGEVGTDMKSIPTESIERIEVLRDGAAAQYGSDAIAGVINIVLKERTDGQISLNTGITTAGDGLTYDAGIYKGFKVGKGFIGLTGSFYHQDRTNRAGEPGSDVLFGVDATNPWIQENPDLGMTIGQPEYDKYSAMANFGLPYSKTGKFYATAGYTYRDGTSFALYRTPYWITDDAGLLTPDGEEYQGFQPTFETKVNDITFIAGTKNKFAGWDSDLSFSYGANNVSYNIGNTINPALLPNSPTNFDAGAYAFSNIIGNLDLSKSFNKLTTTFGIEGRQETFEVVAGQEESYIEGGAQSFPGLQPGNALKENRSNIGAYAGLDFDLTKNTFIGGALRYENYTDFGGNLSWKINARQFINNQKGAIRASVSTGFRAPSLHQIYLSNVQTLVSGGTISNQGTFNNVSDVIVGLGVPALDAEKSLNFTAGLTYRITDNISLSADYYNVTVRNRVLFTGEIGFDGNDDETNAVEEILIDQKVTSIKYFVNALDTRNSGFDLVADYKASSFEAIVSLNLNNTEILNEDISSPGKVGEAGYQIFNRKEQSRITSARPGTKALIGLSYKLKGFKIGLNNTYFGPVTWQHAADPEKDQTFSGKVITDLLFSYKFNDKLSANLIVNNLLNVYPDVIDTKGDVVTDLGGRFKYPWEVNQFGFMGTIIKAGVNFNF